MVAAIGGDVKILEAVVIVVAHGDSHAVADALQSGLLGHIFKRAVLFLVEEAIPIFRPGFLGDAAFGRWIGERSAIHKKNVETAVVIVVKEGYARAHSFRQVMLRRVRRHVLEPKTQGGGDIPRFAWGWFGLVWRLRRLLRRTGAQGAAENEESVGNQ